MGDPNASIPTPQPVHYRPMFRSHGRALHGSSLTFVSDAALAGGLARKLKVQKRAGRGREHARRRSARKA